MMVSRENRRTIYSESNSGRGEYLSDPAKMVPQRKKKTPSDFDPGHTA